MEVPGSKPGVSYVVTHGGQEPPVNYMFGFSCTCPAFAFSKGEEKTCKHVREAAPFCCLWHEQHDSEDYQGDGKCPRCGGPVQHIVCAV